MFSAGRVYSGKSIAVLPAAIMTYERRQEQQHRHRKQVAADCGPHCRKSEVVCQ